MQKKTNLSLRSTVINRAPPGNYLHNQNSKAINITLFIQHSSAGVLRCNIAIEMTT